MAVEGFKEKRGGQWSVARQIGVMSLQSSKGNAADRALLAIMATKPHVTAIEMTGIFQKTSARTLCASIRSAPADRALEPNTA